MIREARLTDMDAIMQVFSAAKRIMRHSGNMHRLLLVSRQKYSH